MRTPPARIRTIYAMLAGTATIQLRARFFGVA